MSTAVPYLLSPLESVDTYEDETITFRCMAAGTPQPTVTWYSNGKLLQGLQRTCLIDVSLFSAHYDQKIGRLFICTASMIISDFQ